ncbi:MAG: hypothetical protein AMXMBFR64_54980 [Myxococcales bacterium]
MLTRIIDVCLQHRLVVLLATALSAVAGVWAFLRLPLDAFPDTTPVQVAIDTEAPALGPLEVERQITLPVEQALAGLPGLEEVRSASRSGYSQVVAVFADGQDLWRARQVVAERVSAVELPPSVGRPTLGPVVTGLGEVLQYLVTSRERDLAALRTLHERIIRPQLLQVPGVAEVNTWGGQVPQLHVEVEPQALASLGLTIDDVAGAIERNNRSVGGGILPLAGEGVTVQGDGIARTAADVESIGIAAVDGTPVLLGDVARVEPGHALRRGATTAEGAGEVVLGLGFALTGESSHVVTDGLLARLEEVKKNLPPDVKVTPVYARTTLVDRVLHTVRTNLLEGALLVIGVLFALLGNLRAGLIVTLAIPLSLLFAFDAMVRFGVAGTLMSLGAIDFGLVVDSSVILVENAERRLAEDKSGRSVREIVRDAAVEVRRPTLFGELIIMIVYLPVLTLEGVEGKLFRPMALTVIFALIGSMILSLTLMPVLASLVLRRGRTGHRGTLLSRALLALYRPVLGGALRWRALVLVLAAAAVAGAALLAPRLGTEFVPRLREQSIVINTVRGAGIHLDESVRVGESIERLLLDTFPDEIAHIWTRTGTAEVATDPMGPEVSDVFLTLTPREQWKAATTQEGLERRMAEALEGLPGMRATFTQPVEMRLNEMAAGLRSDIGVKIFGDDLDLLREKAGEVERMLEGIPGAVDVSVEQLTGASILLVEVDREAAGRLGLSVDAVLSVVEALGQRVVGQITEPTTLWRTDIALRIEGAGADPDQVEALLVPGPDGSRVRLGDVAKVRLVEGPSMVQREWGKRRVVVQANVRGRDVGSFAAELEGALAGLELPDGAWWRIGGQLKHLESARKRLLVVVPVAVLLVFALLTITYGRLRDALRVFTGVPFSAVGGILALWVRGMPFSVSAAVGFVALFGVSVLGDMVLVSRVRQLLAAGHTQLDAIREAAETRLRPVLMTGLVAALGFVPMALSTGLGAEIQRPLATVVIGGIATSTLATLLVLPVLYALFGAGRPKEVTP